MPNHDAPPPKLRLGGRNYRSPRRKQASTSDAQLIDASEAAVLLRSFDDLSRDGVAHPPDQSNVAARPHLTIRSATIGRVGPGEPARPRIRRRAISQRGPALVRPVRNRVHELRAVVARLVPAVLPMRLAGFFCAVAQREEQAGLAVRARHGLPDGFLCRVVPRRDVVRAAGPLGLLRAGSNERAEQVPDHLSAAAVYAARLATVDMRCHFIHIAAADAIRPIAMESASDKWIADEGFRLPDAAPGVF